MTPSVMTHWFKSSGRLTTFWPQGGGRMVLALVVFGIVVT
jgi:hypothetical protein